MATEKPLPDMPNKPAKPKRTETLHMAYDPSHDPGAKFHDVVVFGTKLEALEYAMEQDPAWKVAPIVKGQRLTEAVTS